jgi:hypothetical protein
VDGARSALIVATDEYADQGLRRLRAPAADAQALVEVLRDPGIGGFEVRTLLNRPAHEVNLAMEEFFFPDRRSDDLLLLYVSCHAVKDEDGELYFATANTRLRRLEATAVPAVLVDRWMSRTRSRRVVLLLDCSYGGAFARGMAPRAGTGMGIEEQFGGRGRAVITASSAMEYAFEGDELADARELAPSVFTSALVEGLETGEADRDQDGLVGLDELYDYVYDRVRAVTPNQTPGKWAFDVQGDLVIARARRVTTPAPLPPELQQAIDHPISAVRASAVQELARLLPSRHAGLVLAARLALERLANDDSRRVAAAATAVLSDQAGAGLGAEVQHDTQPRFVMSLPEHELPSTDLPSVPAPSDQAAAPSEPTSVASETVEAPDEPLISPTVSKGVFISYRRQESSGMAGRLYDRLVARFGDDQVFMDVDKIALGVDFAEVITQAVGTCEVLLAVIGPHWLTATDEDGQRRLDDPDDIVRVEIQAALKRNIRVIPILVEGAVMPRGKQLPEGLVSLARRNALSVRHESFRDDADRLLKAIEQVVRVTGSSPS